MSNRTPDQDFSADDLPRNEDLDLLEEEEQQVHKSRKVRAKVDMRQRIEERLEELRLQRELGDYESFALDEEDSLH